MNNKITTSLLAGFILPAAVSALSIDITRPSTDSFFQSVVDAMSSDVSALFAPENTGSFTEAVFYTNIGGGFTNSFWETDGADGEDAPFKVNGITPGGHAGLDSWRFVQVDNVVKFTFSGPIDIGFVGNESLNRNRLTLRVTDGTDTVEEELFRYLSDNGTGNGLVTSHNTATVEPEPMPLEGAFWHYNRNSLAFAADQGNELKFRMYRQLNDDGNFADAYLFIIDDRMKDQIDFDDGIFYLSGSFTPVPEPSHIALLAVLGMGIILMVRRRLHNQKAKS